MGFWSRPKRLLTYNLRRSDRHQQLLTRILCEQAPQIPRWTFYPSRQPGSLDGLVLTFGEKRFNPAEIWITPTLDFDSERIDIVCWHPEWADLDERQKWTMLFLFLDEILGEYGTQSFIGKMEFGDSKLKDALPLSELRPYIGRTREEKGWSEKIPGENSTLYQFEEPHNHFPRGDILIGNTRLPKLLEDYLEAEGNLQDPLAGTGAEYAYLQFESKQLERGNEVDGRARIEDAIEHELRPSGSGRILGGAFGTTNSYIDLLVLDAEESVTHIQKLLHKISVSFPVSLHYFDPSKHPKAKRLV